MKENYQKVLDTINLYPQQIKQAWEEVDSLIIPEEYKSIKNIVFCGMGGSALGARVVDSLLINELNIPFEIFTEYQIPAYANENTLVIVSSYSGGTEETLHCATSALNKGCKIFGITTGGKLGELLKEKNLPSYIFNPKYNPSSQPRMALGYSISSILSLLKKLKLIEITNEKINTSIEFMRNVKNINDVEIYSQELYEKIPILIAAEHLKGISHAFKNQLNENAKTFTLLFDIPELNHHLMEGLANPKQAKNILHFLFFESDLYSEKIQKRFPLTKNVVEKNDISSSIYKLKGLTKLDQIFEILNLGSLISLELAKKYSVDIMSIPWVDYFKKQLSIML
jgi:glucose/mannose-6-phosphate isomerase